MEPKRILVVDDSALMRRLLSGVLVSLADRADFRSPDIAERRNDTRCLECEQGDGGAVGFSASRTLSLRATTSLAAMICCAASSGLIPASMFSSE